MPVNRTNVMFVALVLEEPTSRGTFFDDREQLKLLNAGNPIGTGSLDRIACRPLESCDEKHSFSIDTSRRYD